MKKCTACGEKKIKDAYHVICGDCVRTTSKCGKCLLPDGQWIKEGSAVEISESGEIKRVVDGDEKAACCDHDDSEAENCEEDCEEDSEEDCEAEN